MWVQAWSGSSSPNDLVERIVRQASRGLKMPAADSPSREEVNAKLEAVEARLDGRLAGIAADIKIIVSGQASMRDDSRDVRRDIGSYKTTVIVTGVAIVAMMLGFLAFGVSILELASGLFEAGASK